MDLVVITLGILTLVLGSYLLLNHLIPIGYTIFMLFRFMRDVREEQEKEVDKLLNEQG